MVAYECVKRGEALPPSRAAASATAAAAADAAAHCTVAIDNVLKHQEAVVLALDSVVLDLVVVAEGEGEGCIVAATLADQKVAVFHVTAEEPLDGLGANGGVAEVVLQSVWSGGMRGGCEGVRG